jgi:hypothetical protein
MHLTPALFFKKKKLIVQYVSHAEIFRYTEDIHRQRLFKEKKQPNKKVDDAAEVDEEVVTSSRESDIVHSAAMSKSLKIIERMVNQNTYDEVAQDFKLVVSLRCISAQAQRHPQVLGGCQRFLQGRGRHFAAALEILHRSCQAQACDLYVLESRVS